MAGRAEREADDEGHSVNVHCRSYRGATNEWQTPPDILAALGPFDDDPAQANSLDGFLRPWHGLVFLNPPYGPGIGEWLQKLSEHGSGVALIFARTETRWFIESVWKKARSLRFLYGRPHFYLNGQRAVGNCGGPLVLVAYGEEGDRRVRETTLAGMYVRLHQNGGVS